MRTKLMKYKIQNLAVAFRHGDRIQITVRRKNRVLPRSFRQSSRTNPNDEENFLLIQIITTHDFSLKREKIFKISTVNILKSSSFLQQRSPDIG